MTTSKVPNHKVMKALKAYTNNNTKLHHIAHTQSKQKHQHFNALKH